MLTTTLLTVIIIAAGMIAAAACAGASERSGRRVRCVAFGWSDMPRHEDYGGPRRRPGDGGPGAATA